MTTANTHIHIVAQAKIGVRMNGTDVTGPCIAVQYGLIMFTCGSRKMEFWHDGKPIEWNAELRMVQLGSVIGKPNRPTVFRRPLASTYPGITF